MSFHFIVFEYKCHLYRLREIFSTFDSSEWQIEQKLRYESNYVLIKLKLGKKKQE